MPATNATLQVTPSTRARLRAAAHHLIALDPADVRDRSAQEQYRIGATLWRHASYDRWDSSKGGHAIWRKEAMGPPALHSSPLQARGHWMRALACCLRTPAQAKAAAILWQTDCRTLLVGRAVTPSTYGCARYYDAGSVHSDPRISIKTGKDPRREYPLVLQAMIAAGVRPPTILHWADGIYRAANDVRTLYKLRMHESCWWRALSARDARAKLKPSAADRQWPEKATDLANDLSLQ